MHQKIHSNKTPKTVAEMDRVIGNAPPPTRAVSMLDTHTEEMSSSVEVDPSGSQKQMAYFCPRAALTF